jgi:hypothetical protein
MLGCQKLRLVLCYCAMQDISWQGLGELLLVTARQSVIVVQVTVSILDAYLGTTIYQMFDINACMLEC